MKRQYRIFSFFLFSAIAMFTSCSSVDSGKETKKTETEKENPVVVKAREEWKKFAEEKRLEEKRRQDMTSMENDNLQVFPWRSDTTRRSQKLHDQENKSVISLW